ncbi:MAG: beta-phosphoglucomutase [Chloroflexi bacterium]|nr:MAG: beta-phosphoglucomutase [Chloroflexota bacterium]
MKPKAVIFDLDGVLTDTVEYHYISWKEAVEPYGIPFVREDNESLLGLTRRQSLEVILGDRKLDEKTKLRILAVINENFLKSVRNMSPQDVLPGVDRLLGELRLARTKIAVASASRNAKIVLEQLGLASSIDVIVDSSMVRKSKPAPDVFLNAAGALNENPKTCLVVEDSRAGVDAALRAGMCVVGIGLESRLKEAHSVFPSLISVHREQLVEAYEHWINRIEYDLAGSDTSSGNATGRNK